MSAESPTSPNDQEGPQIRIQLPNGQQPTPEQIEQMRKQISADAAKHGLTVPQFLEKLKEQQMAQQQQQQQQQQAQQAQQQMQPINPGEPTKEALALAKFLQSQDLKVRQCILNGQRKEMFKGMQLFFFFQKKKLVEYQLLIYYGQLNVRSELSSPRPTRKPARRTLSSQKSPTAHLSRTASSCCPSPCSPSVSPKSIPMKATTTPLERTRSSASRDSGPSRLSSSKNAEKSSTLSGSTKARRSSKNSTQWELLLWYLVLSCSRSGP